MSIYVNLSHRSDYDGRSFPLCGERHLDMSIGTSLTLSKDSATDVDTNTVVYDLLAADSGRSDFSVAGITPPSNKLLISDIRSERAAKHDTKLGSTELKLMPSACRLHLALI